MLTLHEISSILGTPPSPNIPLTGFCIDSRKVEKGNLFVAIRGDRFDGHDFIKDAVQKGAAAILCTESRQDQVTELLVPDTTKALAEIAKQHRQKLNCNVVALTGSNGKTTVKEMIAAILPKPSHATPGNLNNHIGVPLTVLQLQPEHGYAVFELGANHIGEIAHTVSIVQPKVTLINNIAPAHIGEFGSIEGVARTKGEIHQGLMPGGTAIINADDEYAHFWDSTLAGKKILRFSRKLPADVFARDVNFNEQGCAKFTLVLPSGQAQVQLSVPGAHNVGNALAAAASTFALGVSLEEIVNGLNSFSGVSGRMTFLAGKNKSTVIDDTYNANLRSVLTALDVLSTHKGRRIFVFGDMGELGSWTQEHHLEVGKAARIHGIEVLMTCGTHSKHTSYAFGDAAKHYVSQDALVKDLLQELNENTTVLVKGSRSAEMEKIVHQLVC
jgi:UDP-N-acetylmuramoyl-tripeptide--D-alanyl-D-alanine ligase